MKKQIIVLGLAVLGAIAVNNNASAQTIQPGIGTKMGTFTLADKGIKVNHTVLSAPGKVDFTLTNVSGKKLGDESGFVLNLPFTPGLKYDLSTLKGNISMSQTGGGAPTFVLNEAFNANATLSFTCDLVKDNSTPPLLQQITIRTK